MKLPPPGSATALMQGCVCPVLDNNHGKWAPFPPDGWWTDPDCPVHQPAPKEEDASEPGMES